ncbi:MAG: GNAT family N-acetyltransferase [Burkholderiaceae bacterium]|nr:GNAT family N-acetyltransferase [Burkholderiaceae bacterium]
MEIFRANLNHLDLLTDLFDAYRVFYKAASQPESAREFIANRLRLQDSVVFLAMDETNQGMGFLQLYPVFSSVAMQPAYLLNDLFVAPRFRQKSTGRSVASALIRACEAYAKQVGVSYLFLQTAHTNTQAQAVYEHLGWKLDETFRVYERILN